MKETVTLRHATLSDSSLLKEWDSRPHVIESDPNDEWNWDEEPGRDVDWREQLIAEVHGKPVGFIQIIDAAEEETHYWGTVEPGTMAIDIWIGELESTGKGIGTAMMKQAMDRCFEKPGVHTILIDPLVSNTNAIRFYKKLGFVDVENRQFGPDDCLVMKFSKLEQGN